MVAFSEQRPGRADLVVVGGGLAGLTAAAKAAKAGKSVILLEQAKTVGGRAATLVRDGVHFNLGAHALYKAGHAARVLGELGVEFTGKTPKVGRFPVFLGGKAFVAPVDTWGLLTSRLLGLREKARFVGFLRSVGSLETSALAQTHVRDWLRERAGDGNLEAILRTLFRVTTYAADPGALSAGAALDQFRLSLAGVLYVDGGWQTLADGLRDAARRSGASVLTSARVEALRNVGNGVDVRLADGSELHAGAAVVALAPKAACSVLGLSEDAPLARRVAKAVPLRAACLDLALDGLARPNCRFALGVDAPLYYSLHSATANLARRGVAVVQMMKYLAPGAESASQARAIEGELEAWLDVLQPGWRSRVLDRRFLPGMVVSHDSPRPETGGLAGRPAVADSGVPGVFLAGDWVGPVGLLADAAAASGEAAASAALAALDHAYSAGSLVDVGR
jgi:phytoene dehydrogenase-like protein